MKFDKSQEQAIEKAIANKITAIIGEAGVGKTTIIKELVQRLDNVILCCPTGKGAARMKQATGFPASTIHRMLGWNTQGFIRGDFVNEVVIVDECSMVESSLMYEIIKRKPAKLIMVGDECQLLPVGAGAPFHDVIKHCPNQVVKLEKSYRNSEAVFEAGHAVRNRIRPELMLKTANEMWKVVDISDIYKKKGMNNIANNVPKYTEEYILDKIKKGMIDFDKDIIAVCRNKETYCSVESLNQKIVDIVNPRVANEKWKTGDRIMLLKNNAGLDVYNGDTGKIVDIDIKGNAWIELDSPRIAEDGLPSTEVVFTKAVLKNCVLAYACTVWKLQGSQYRTVIFVCLNRDLTFMLTNNLIYTAITRAKKNCIVAGDNRAFFSGIFKKQNRQTVLDNLLINNEV